MHRHLSSFIGLTLLSGAAMAAPGESASTQPEQSEPASSVQSTTSTGQETATTPGMEQQSQIHLVATDELIGREVTTQEGERLGTLQFVTVNLDRGSVSHLVIDTSGTAFSTSQTESASQPASPGRSSPETTGQDPSGQGAPDTQSSTAQQGEASTAQQGQPSTAQQGEDELVIVPWNVAKVDPQSDSIVLAATGHHIANAPRLQREELNRLSEPTLASYVIDYWAPVSEMAALEGRAESQSGAEQDRSTQQRPTDLEKNTQDPQQFQRQDQQPPQSLDQAGVNPQPGASGAAETGEPETAPIGEVAQPSDTSPSQTQPRSSSSQGGEQMVLIGQEVVAAVAPPMFQLSKDLRGARVLDQSGENLGEIRQIMIDAETGTAAFAVVEGTPAGRAPVPLQALEWTADGTTLLTADASSLQSDQALTEQPGQVSRSQLADLYQRFGAEPYWQQSGSQTTTPEPSPEEWPQ